MQKVKLTRIARQQKTSKQNKPYTSVGIQVEDDINLGTADVLDHVIGVLEAVEELDKNPKLLQRIV